MVFRLFLLSPDILLWTTATFRSLRASFGLYPSRSHEDLLAVAGRTGLSALCGCEFPTEAAHGWLSLAEKKRAEWKTRGSGRAVVFWRVFA